MLLYLGSKLVKGNKFKDKKGNILIFEKATKNGKIFSTEKGKVALTESYINKLELIK